jgi:hypothetical protein
VSLGVGGALTDLSRLGGVGNGREDGTVLGKHLGQFLSVMRQREMVAVFCDYGLDEGRLGARSTDRRV